MSRTTGCNTCYYGFFASVSEDKEDIWACQYCLIEGHRRGCPVGPDCTKYKPKTSRSFTKSWFSKKRGAAQDND